MTIKQVAWYRGVAAAVISTAATSLSGLLGAALAKPELLKGGLTDLFAVLGCAGIASGMTGLFLFLQKSPLPPTADEVDEMKAAIVASMPKPKVLLIDDCQDFHLLAQMKIPECEVVTAGTCADGKRKCAAMPFDAIVIDRVLPDCDGLDLVPVLHDLQPKARLIVITGYPIEPEMVRRASQSGAVAFLNKDMNGFFDELRHFLTGAHQLLDKGLNAAMMDRQPT